MFKKISWIVIEGKKLGRTIWFPTANIKVENEKIEDGTYKINIVLSWKKYSWVWVFLEKESLFEAHIFDFNEFIYWEEIEVYILDKIRWNKKFSWLEELKSQIKKDSKKSKEIEDIVLTFWTFDIFHEWHKHFLNEAKNYWDKLVTIVATDENVFRFKWTLPENNENKRREIIKKSWISDLVEVWEWNNPMKWIDIYNPKVICLWYDQIWFSEMLKNYIKEKKINIQVLRLKPFKENIYKSSLLKKIK